MPRARKKVPKAVRKLVAPSDAADLTEVTDQTVAAANETRVRAHPEVAKFLADVAKAKARILWRDYKAGKQRRTITRAALRADAMARYMPDHYLGQRGTNCGTFARMLFSILTHRDVPDDLPDDCPPYPMRDRRPMVSVASFGYRGSPQGHWFVLVTDGRWRIYQSEMNSFNFALASAVLRVRKVHPYNVRKRDLDAFLSREEIDAEAFVRLFHFRPPLPTRGTVRWLTAPLLPEFRIKA